ncbi:MAG: nicotinate phosphoribosyltransferase [Chrysothrix sp. TS-e1954]|nr:MAG: nicotinate phosphoribosyltransferase [Chrysothrix sp. TS-e1954]
MAITTTARDLPEGVFSLLDTDLYKITMQSAVLKHFPRVEVTYSFTNRTPHMRLSREAFEWLRAQIQKLHNITLSEDELQYLRQTCTFLSAPYLHFLQNFRLRPSEHITTTFTPEKDNGSDGDLGQVDIEVRGLWVDTILYEIPLLALTSEAYFKFCDKDWTYDGQVDSARRKGLRLLETGCLVSEFGTRRRRDYHAQELVLKGLQEASTEGRNRAWTGKITGTSNVHFAMKFGIPPIGTVAHEWFMGVAAVTDSYKSATEAALSCWVATFGKGVLGIALTDTFGTPTFLEAFSKRIPRFARTDTGAATVLPSAAAHDASDHLTTTSTPLQHTEYDRVEDGASEPSSYADIFTGTRQDSGDPLEFIKVMRRFYDDVGIKQKKTIVFSDSLNVERCIEYRQAAEAAGFQPSFGVGTFFTNDFNRASDGLKSAPLNIVIKLSSADGKPAIKISDNLGKNTGDSSVVADVKRELGYHEKAWSDGDESARWKTASAAA